MASSFDTVSTWDTVYHEVMALYSAIMDTPGTLKVQRAEIRQGEVKALSIDFKIDVELKAKRALQDDPYSQREWAIVLADPFQYPDISIITREKLGAEFMGNRLGVDGDYRMLYWRVKNHHQNIPQEVANGVFE